MYWSQRSGWWSKAERKFLKSVKKSEHTCLYIQASNREYPYVSSWPPGLRGLPGADGAEVHREPDPVCSSAGAHHWLVSVRWAKEQTSNEMLCLLFFNSHSRDMEYVLLLLLRRRCRGLYPAVCNVALIIRTRRFREFRLIEFLRMKSFPRVW